jgi:hypothetical protein
LGIIGDKARRSPINIVIGLLQPGDWQDLEAKLNFSTGGDQDYIGVKGHIDLETCKEIHGLGEGNKGETIFNEVRKCSGHFLFLRSSDD